jgi:hypothetical protein
VRSGQFDCKVNAGRGGYIALSDYSLGMMGCQPIQSTSAKPGYELRLPLGIDRQRRPPGPGYEAGEEDWENSGEQEAVGGRVHGRWGVLAFHHDASKRKGSISRSLCAVVEPE